MKAHKRTSDSSNYFQEKLAVFRKQLSRYIEEPDGKAIHDVRTAYRRLESAYQVIPQECKTKQTRHFMKLGKQFFRRNSLVRDCDVISEKIEKPRRKKKSELVAKLEKIRNHQLRSAMELAKKLNKSKNPRIDAADIAGTDLLNMQVHKRALQFLSNLPLVVSGESNIEEVHECPSSNKWNR
jgi:CHAD domain-containing protein|tara:strand:- start:15 stop:560 length:546 start_codon:yes stop_codon:yes gene_type:complete